jgi:hypothetical protein
MRIIFAMLLVLVSIAAGVQFVLPAAQEMVQFKYVIALPVAAVMVLGFLLLKRK